MTSTLFSSETADIHPEEIAMFALILTLGFIALLALAAVVPGLLWSGAPDRRGEVRRLHSVPESPDRDHRSAA